jgi:hypothetical protein
MSHSTDTLCFHVTFNLTANYINSFFFFFGYTNIHETIILCFWTILVPHAKWRIRREFKNKELRKCLKLKQRHSYTRMKEGFHNIELRRVVLHRPRKYLCVLSSSCHYSGHWNLLAVLLTRPYSHKQLKKESVWRQTSNSRMYVRSQVGLLECQFVQSNRELLAFQGSPLPTYTLKMTAAGSSEYLVTIYHNIRNHNPENQNLNVI